MLRLFHLHKQHLTSPSLYELTMQPHIVKENGLSDRIARPSPSSSRPASQQRCLGVGQETYTEHWRRVSRQSGDFEGAQLHPSFPALPTASRQDTQVVEIPYEPERIVYSVSLRSSQCINSPIGGHSLLQADSSSSTSQDLDLVSLPGPRLARKPTPRRVYAPDPVAEHRHNAAAGRRSKIKSGPGCCDVCEISSAAGIGSCLGGWLTGILKITLTSMAACCAAKLC